MALTTHPRLSPKLKKRYSNAYAAALGFHSLYWCELCSICTVVGNTIRLLIPVDDMHSTNTDRKGTLICREIFEDENKEDSLLYTKINKLTVKKCVFVCFNNMDSWIWTDRTATECSHGIIDDKIVS